jgi:uncharacterized protein with NAD-binding domain and iron-sulfur cluster
VNASDAAPGKTKVAVLGGGPGGVAAAFWLTATQALRERFDVTLHTQGWRLGGKCASGRNLAQGARIEEHGLHVLMGCYRRAFETIRACYGEWQPGPASPFKVWTDAFSPVWTVAAQQEDSGTAPARWAPWTFELPELPGWPGDEDGAATDTDAQIAQMAAALQRQLDAGLDSDLAAELAYAEAFAELQRLAGLPPGGLTADPGRTAATVRDAATRVRARVNPTGLGATAGFPDPIARLLILADLGLTAGIGWLLDLCGRGQAGYDALNAQDFRGWLAAHGATEATLASPPLRALYDLTFAYRDGDASSIDNGSLAAGVTFRFALDLGLGYRHAPFWKMNAGTGDAIFTPLYQVLAARGVNIEFFHRVTAIDLTTDGAQIGSIEIAQQAEVSNGSYRPFVAVKGLDCWPDQPLWDQLAGGAALRARGTEFESAVDATAAATLELRLGTDFDQVVLAVPPDVIRPIAPTLASADARWASMLDGSTSVATEAFQRWLAPPFADLGWTSSASIVSAYAERFDSWADMSQQLALEDWPAQGAPQAIEYFCGCLPQASIPADPAKDAEAWLAASIAPLWPMVVDANGQLKPGTVVSAYDRANETGYERYVQTPAGSVQYRLPPAPARFGNLYLAGDWTLTRYSGGCFESAIEAGWLAAQAIAGSP